MMRVTLYGRYARLQDRCDEDVASDEELAVDTKELLLRGELEPQSTDRRRAVARGICEERVLLDIAHISAAAGCPGRQNVPNTVAVRIALQSQPVSLLPRSPTGTARGG